MNQTTEINNIQEALAALGVSEDSLSAAQKKQLDEQGYLILPKLLDPAWLEELRSEYDRLIGLPDETGQAKKEGNTRHMLNLLNRSTAFDRIYSLPPVLAAAWRVLQAEFRLAEVTGRDPLPGGGAQGLHTDWRPRQPTEPYQAFNSVWFLDDFTSANGPTRLVPGSHRLTTMPPKSTVQPNVKHPNEILATGPAGSVLVFNGHTWHSGTQNHSQHLRRSLHCFAVLRSQGYMNQNNYTLQPQTLARLSPAVRYLLDS